MFITVALGFGCWFVTLVLYAKSAELYKKYSKNQKPDNYYVDDHNGVPLNWGDYLGYFLIAVWIVFIYYVIGPLFEEYLL